MQVVQHRGASFSCILATAAASGIELSLVTIVAEQQHPPAAASKVAVQQVQQLARLQLSAGTAGVKHLLEARLAGSLQQQYELHPGCSYSTELLAITSSRSQASLGDSSADGSSSDTWLRWDVTVSCSATGMLQVATSAPHVMPCCLPTNGTSITCLSTATGPAVVGHNATGSQSSALQSYFITGSSRGLVQLWGLGQQAPELMLSLQPPAVQSWDDQEASSCPVAAVAACPGLHYLAAVTSGFSGRLWPCCCTHRSLGPRQVLANQWAF